MRIDQPDPHPREDGDYDTYTTGGYGQPNATIFLDEERKLRLGHVTLADCERLMAALAKILPELVRYNYLLTVAHGRGDIYKGTCQLCGKPEDDELHAEPKPLAISDETIRQAKWLGEHGAEIDAEMNAKAAS